jgi:NTP pyrophosphatase (non-canonical NTP hydrolase)
VSDTDYTCKGYLDFLNKRIKVWREGKGFLTSWKNVGDKLLLVVSELTEAFEAYRDLSPAVIEKLDVGKTVLGTSEILRKQLGALANFNEELADTYIRLGDLCASLGIDIERHIHEKTLVNEQRPKKHGRQR